MFYDRKFIENLADEQGTPLKKKFEYKEINKSNSI